MFHAANKLQTNLLSRQVAYACYQNWQMAYIGIFYQACIKEIRIGHEK